MLLSSIVTIATFYCDHHKAVTLGCLPCRCCMTVTLHCMPHWCCISLSLLIFPAKPHEFVYCKLPGTSKTIKWDDRRAQTQHYNISHMLDMKFTIVPAIFHGCCSCSSVMSQLTRQEHQHCISINNHYLLHVPRPRPFLCIAAMTKITNQHFGL